MIKTVIRCSTLGCSYLSYEYPDEDRHDAWACPVCEFGHLQVVEGRDEKHADRINERADRMQDLEDNDARYRNQVQAGKSVR